VLHYVFDPTTTRDLVTIKLPPAKRVLSAAEPDDASDEAVVCVKFINSVMVGRAEMK
jgi:hypothetical protein